MKKVKSNNKKFNFHRLFILDVNPGNDELTKDMVMGKLGKTILSVSQNEAVVIASHSSLYLMQKLCNDIGLKKGFIISDSGARIFSIHENKIIYQIAMNMQDVDAIIHFAIMQDGLALLSASKHEYAYSINYSNTIALNKKHYLPLPYTDDYQKIKSFANSTIIHSVLVFFTTRELMLQFSDSVNKVANNWEFWSVPGQKTYLSINNKGTNKYHAILNIMRHINLTNNDYIFYYGINAISISCMAAIKNKIIIQETAIESSFPIPTNEQGSINKVIYSMQYQTSII